MDAGQTQSGESEQAANRGEALAVPLVSVMRKRSDFLAANRGLRNARPGFVLLTRPNGTEAMRFGITVTKKIGNAVVRNRIKRRFRSLLRDALPKAGLAGHDHVMIGRDAADTRDFASLAADLETALTRAAAGKGDKRRPVRKGPSKSARK